jgi:hypothetical protein
MIIVLVGVAMRCAALLRAVAGRQQKKPQPEIAPERSPGAAALPWAQHWAGGRPHWRLSPFWISSFMPGSRPANKALQSQRIARRHQGQRADRQRAPSAHPDLNCREFVQCREEFDLH